MQGFKKSIQSYHGNHIRIPVLEVFINCWKGEFNDSSTDPSQRSLCAWVNAPRWITAFLPFRSNPCALLTKLASSGWMMDSLWEALSGTISELNNPAICSNPPGMSYGTAFFEREKPWKHNDKPISSRSVKQQATRVCQRGTLGSFSAKAVESSAGEPW